MIFAPDKGAGFEVRPHCVEATNSDRMRACFWRAYPSLAGIAQLVEQLTCNQ